MASNNNANKNPLVTLGNMLSLVFDAIAIAQKGLLKNPSKEEERKLNRTLAKLKLERADIRAELDSLIDGEQNIAGPTPAQVKEMSKLIAEVDKLTNASVTASGAVALTSRILALATEVADA
jgi:hypothetical protein